MKNEMHTVRLTSELSAALEAEVVEQRKASGAYISKADVIRQALERYLDAQYSDRVIQSIDAMQDRYGELVTWRTAGNCLALDIPLALVHEANGTGVKRDIALQTLAGLLVPQLDRIPDSMMKDALGSEYSGKRQDYLALVAMAVKELA